jgi:hypothetical protein
LSSKTLRDKLADPKPLAFFWSAAEKAQRERFRLADAYAQAALAEPKLRFRYEGQAKRQKKRARDLAISDYFQGKTLPRSERKRWSSLNDEITRHVHPTNLSRPIYFK